jgi:asparagine synthase (glutamine-hydrolysing)
MMDPTGRYVLTYNGEIYNYKELRSQLSKKWVFQTEGDTEVLLAGLVTEGELFLGKAEGMWAFVLWDSHENRLVAARDRMGKKPLYYFSHGTAFGAASELPALIKLVSFSPSEDFDSTADFLRYGYYLPGTTAFKEIAEVLPGQVLTWSWELGIDATPYWSLDIGGFSGSMKDAIEQTNACLTEAVRSRLVADVEVGAFLSGGIDSSLIVALMVNRLNVLPPKTFTIGFNEKSYDERKYARQIASYYKTEHREQCLDRWDRERLESILLNHVGQPFYDASLLPTDMVCNLASQHVKVALSGDGGDELFSGYQRYQARTILRWYMHLPKFFRKNTERAIRLLPEPMQHHSRSVLKKAHLFLDILERQKSETPYIAPVLYSECMFTGLAGDIAKKGHAPPPHRLEPVEDIMDMMRADATVYLPQDILVKVDRASMAHSLEVRAPFLDSRVVQLAFSLPISWHRDLFRGKRMLHKTFGQLLPSNLWRRRKQGFGVPIHQWFRSDLGIQLEELLAYNQTPLNITSVLDMLDEHRRGIRDHGFRLWNIYVYLLWRDQ